MLLLANCEGPDQTARMPSLILAFTVGISLKTHFCPVAAQIEMYAQIYILTASLALDCFYS